jgi:hypothetical protein
MEIFCRLLFGHLLADFTFQTNYIAEWKRRSFYGLLVHVVIHPVCYIIILWPMMNSTWIHLFGMDWTGWVVVGVLTVFHFFEDWFRVTMVNRGWPDNTVFYTWDQLVHIFFIWLFSPIRSQHLQSDWTLFGILCVLVTHFATVTIWFIEKDIYGGEYPETEEKYITIVQRLALLLAFFLPSPWWIIIAVAIMIIFGRHIWTRRIDFSWRSIILGNAMAVLFGLIGRFGFDFKF